VTVDGEKMAKSVGNIRTVHSLLEDHPGEVIRLALLGAHYRQPMDWTEGGLAQAQKSLDRWYRAAADAGPTAGEVQDSVLAPMLDNLNTAEAIAALHGLADAALAGSAQAAADLRASGGLLGVLQSDADSWFHGAAGGGRDSTALDGDKIELLIERRAGARRDRDFAEADRIRAELEAAGVILEDGAGGTTWRRAG
jgi:cysteinyl-tRNA synthetase